MTAEVEIDLTPEKDGGVLKKILVEGKGEQHPCKGDTVFVHYVGTLESGEEFDSSRARLEPFSFTLGNGQVIKGWDLGVATMKKGEKCILTCRADYAYGDKGSPPKIPGGATLRFEVELIRWHGEDISPDRDGTITRSIIVEGEKYSSPSEGSTVKEDLHILVNKFVQVRGHLIKTSEVREDVGLPEGIDRALRRFNKGEKSAVHLKGSRFTYGASPPPEYSLPPNAELDFTLFLTDYEKIKASWEMTGDEKLEAAETTKQRGTMFFSEGKYHLAEAKYLRVIELLEYETSFDSNVKPKRDALLLAGYNNCALAYAKQGETANCIKYCDKALEMDAKCVKALYRKASALLEQNDIDEALSVFKKVLEMEPDNKAAAQSIITCRKKLAVIREQQKKRFKGMFEKLSAKDPVSANEADSQMDMTPPNSQAEVVN